MKVMAILIAVVALPGCGRLDRWVAGWTGGGSETCHKGVVYLQFTSGATVAYNPDGSIMRCK